MTTSFEDVQAMAETKGRVVKQCEDPEYVALDCGEAPDSNERMRMTAHGAVLILDKGRFWQVGPIADVYIALKGLP